MIAGATAETVRLAWDPSPETNVVRYFVYRGTAPRSYDWKAVVEVPETTATIEGLEPGTTYYFAVTAGVNDGVWAFLESDFSTEVYWNSSGSIIGTNGPPGAPDGVTLSFR